MNDKALEAAFVGFAEATGRKRVTAGEEIGIHAAIEVYLEAQPSDYEGTVADPAHMRVVAGWCGDTPEMSGNEEMARAALLAAADAIKSLTGQLELYHNGDIVHSATVRAEAAEAQIKTFWSLLAKWGNVGMLDEARAALEQANE